MREDKGCETLAERRRGNEEECVYEREERAECVCVCLSVYVCVCVSLQFEAVVVAVYCAISLCD